MHIADAMLRIGRPATAIEIAEKLRELYPECYIYMPRLRCRLISFERSLNCVLRTNYDVRPRTYHMEAITRDFFRCTDGIENTIIPEPKEEHDDRDVLVALRKLWDDVARRRQRHKASVTA